MIAKGLYIDVNEMDLQNEGTHSLLLCLHATLSIVCIRTRIFAGGLCGCNSREISLEKVTSIFESLLPISGVLGL